MAAQLNMPPKADGAFYVLSYQGSTRLYNEFDLKKELAKVIIANGGRNLKSYTDSTIIFTGNYNIPSFTRLKDAIETKRNAFRPKVYFSIVLAVRSEESGNYLYANGDEELNIHFQELLETI